MELAITYHNMHRKPIQFTPGRQAIGKKKYTLVQIQTHMDRLQCSLYTNPNNAHTCTLKLGVAFLINHCGKTGSPMQDIALLGT